MSFFLILTVAIMAGAAVLIVRRRSQRAASRSGRYRSPRAGLNLERPAGLPNRSRRENGPQSNSLAGPIFLALVVVVMVFWVVAAFFLPEGGTGSAMVSEPKADASPPEQFNSLAGRLSSEPAYAAGSGVMAQAAARASGPALPPNAAPAGGPLMVAAQSMAPTGNSHLGQVGLQAGRAAAKPGSASGSSAKSAGTAAQTKAAQTPPAQPNRSAAAPAPRNTAAPASAAVRANPVTPAPPASGARSSVVSAASASSAPRAAASGAIAPAAPSRLDGGPERRPSRPAQDEGALASSREFTVHLGSFTDQDNAEKYKSKLDGVGETAFISQVTMEGRLWFRVMSGRFNTRAAAEAHGKDLKRRGLTVDTGRYLIKSLD